MTKILKHDVWRLCYPPSQYENMPTGKPQFLLARFDVDMEDENIPVEHREPRISHIIQVQFYIGEQLCEEVYEYDTEQDRDDALAEWDESDCETVLLEHFQKLN